MISEATKASSSKKRYGIQETEQAGSKKARIDDE